MEANVVAQSSHSEKMTMRVPQYGFATALVLSASMFAAPVHAAEPGPDTLPIHVISVQTMDADDQAEALTKALRQSVRAMPGWSQAEGDYSLEVLTLSLKCSDPPDAGCQSRIADQIRADRYVWGVLGKGKSNNVEGELSFWVRGKGTTTYKLNYSANLTEAQDEALKKVAMDAILKLTDGPPKGEVKISAGGINAQVFVDGQPMGALTAGQGTIFVASGKHQLVVKAPGYADMTSDITVKPNSPTDVTVVPVAVGEKKPINWRLIGGIGAVAAGVGLGVGGLVKSLEVNNLNKSEDWVGFRNQFESDANICEVATGGTVPSGVDGDRVKELCAQADTAQTMQIILYPLAGIAAGAGIFLIATSGIAKGKPKTGWMVLPQFGPTGGKVDVGFSF
jgi:hypothetical protein